MYDHSRSTKAEISREEFSVFGAAKRKICGIKTCPGPMIMYAAGVWGRNVTEKWSNSLMNQTYGYLAILVLLLWSRKFEFLGEKFKRLSLGLVAGKWRITMLRY